MAFKQGSKKKKKPKDKHQPNVSLSSSPQYDSIAKEIQEIREEEERLSFVSFLVSSLAAHAKGEWKEHTRFLKLTGLSASLLLPFLFFSFLFFSYFYYYYY